MLWSGEVNGTNDLLITVPGMYLASLSVTSFSTVDQDYPNFDYFRLLQVIIHFRLVFFWFHTFPSDYDSE